MFAKDPRKGLVNNIQSCGIKRSPTAFIGNLLFLIKKGKLLILRLEDDRRSCTSAVSSENFAIFVDCRKMHIVELADS